MKSPLLIVAFPNAFSIYKTSCPYLCHWMFLFGAYNLHLLRSFHIIRSLCFGFLKKNGELQIVQSMVFVHINLFSIASHGIKKNEISHFPYNVIKLITFLIFFSIIINHKYLWCLRKTDILFLITVYYIAYRKALKYTNIPVELNRVQSQ